MIRRKKIIQLSSVVFHIGVLVTLFVFSGVILALMPTTESRTAAQGSYDGRPVMVFADETVLDKDLFVNGFGRNDVQPYNVPIPTLALLFPLALLLWIKRCRWLIEKQQNFFAFPIF